MNNLYAIKPEGFCLGIPEGLELCDLRCCSAAECVIFMGLAVFSLFSLFGYVLKDGNCQAAFLKLNFKTVYLKAPCVTQAHEAGLETLKVCQMHKCTLFFKVKAIHLHIFVQVHPTPLLSLLIRL